MWVGLLHNIVYGSQHAYKQALYKSSFLVLGDYQQSFTHKFPGNKYINIMLSKYHTVIYL